MKTASTPLSTGAPIPVLSPEQIRHFLERGHVTVKGCFTREAAAPLIAGAWARMGYDPADPKTWKEEMVFLPRTHQMKVADFAPKAWQAICELVGGEDRIASEGRCWPDAFIANLHRGGDKPWVEPTGGLEHDWHKDGPIDSPHFLDSGEYGLLAVVLWSDILPRGGGTLLACDSVGPVARALSEHSKGLRKQDLCGLAAGGRDFVEITGEIGDVVLLHPLLLHARSQNLSGRARLITNTLVPLKEPLRFDRPEAGEHSPVERAILRALASEHFPFRREAQDDPNALINSGRFEEAAAAITRALAADPRDHELWLLQARLQRWNGKLEEAAEAYEKAIAARPNRLEPYMLLAESHLRRGRVEETLATLARAKKDTGGDGGLVSSLERFRLAVCSLDYEEAARIGESVLDRTRDPRHLEWLHWQIFTEEFDFAERPPEYVARALAALDVLVAAKPDSPWGWYYRLLMMELDPARRAGCIAELDRLKAFPPERYGWMRYKAGLMRTVTGDLARAAEDFRAAAKAADDAGWRPLCALTEVLLLKGDHFNALQAFTDVAALNPKRADGTPGNLLGDFLVWKAKLSLWLGDYAAALKTIDSSPMTLGSEMPCYRAAALVGLGRHAEALPLLERAMAQSPYLSWGESPVWKSEALYRLGRFEESAREAEGWLAKIPKGQSEGRLEAMSGKVFFGADQPGLIGIGTPSVLYLGVLRSLSRFALGDTGAARDGVAVLPEAVLKNVRTRKRISGDGPAEQKALLEGVLELSRGVRTGGAALRSWML